ncbi:MAG TPA: hypothetical protein VHT51_04835 [Micropepsaceae bacterium]|jgi:hypothetical protein|nr:hypothetical protein [Micropepsaceae bacterium]
MTIKGCVLIAAATALAGCASMEAQAPAQSASLQNAVYVSNGTPATLQAASTDGQKSSTQPGESKAMQFYWFLGGR